MKQRKTNRTRKHDESAKVIAALARSNTESDVRRRAYELYEIRGRVDGYAMDDWLRAEREMENCDVAVA